MKRFIICLFLSLCLTSYAQAQKSKSPVATPPPVAAVSKDPIGESEKLLTRGEDPGSDKKALAILEASLLANNMNYEFLWRLGRAAYYVGDFSKEEKDKLKAFKRGEAAAQKAVLLKADGVEGHFWLGANYGGQAEIVGALTGIKTVRKIRKEMETVVKLNPAFEYGNAFLALGEIDRNLPAIAGGDKKRAITTFEKGIKLAPENLDLKLTLVKAYREAKRNDDANRLLEEIVKATAVTRIHRLAQEEAKRMLGK